MNSYEFWTDAGDEDDIEASSIEEAAEIASKKIKMTTERITVCGLDIQHDDSGVGHCWMNANEANCPASIQEEIAAEIIDGKQESCDDYRASNGQHYRW